MNAGYKSILVTLVIASLFGCGKTEEESAAGSKAPAPVPLPNSAVIVTEMAHIFPEFKLPAVVEAVQSAHVRPEVSSTIIANHFAPGDLVQKGQLLVELDGAKFKANLDAALAQQASAQASQQESEANWTRAEELMPKGYVSAADYDQIKAKVESARAGVSRAEANLQSARLDLERTRIVAPFSGRIGKPNHAVGDVVSPGIGGALFELAQLDPIYVMASVELSRYNKFVMLRQKLDAEGREIPELKITIELIGAGEYPYEGTFQAWDHTSERTRGMITARSLFPNPEGMLLPGESVTAHGRAIESLDRIFIPQKAVLQDQQGSFVLLLDDTNIVRRKNIVTGIRDGASWAVKSGLEVGDRLIIDGVNRLAPGMQISLGS